MVQVTLGTKRAGRPLARALLAAAVLALGVGTAGAQDEMPVPVLISAPVGDNAEAVFREHISMDIVQMKCINCHVVGGESDHTRLVLVRAADDAEHEATNLQAFRDLLGDFGDHGDGHDHEHGGEYVLTKIQGVHHGGGVQVAAGTNDFDNMDYFLALLENEIAAEAAFHDVSEATVQMKCINCHVVGGVSERTRLVLVRSADDDAHEASNLQTFRDLVAAVMSEGGADYILGKIQGMPTHGGGEQVAAGTDEFDDMEHFLELLEEEPQGFVAGLLEALDDAETSMMFGITTPQDEDTVAGEAVTVSATEAPTDFLHFAYRMADAGGGAFAYLGAAARGDAVGVAWDTSGLVDDTYEVAALYTEDEGDSVTADIIEVTTDNMDPAAPPDIAENADSKVQALDADETHEVTTADGVVVTVPAGALASDDRITITTADTPDAATAPGESVGTGAEISLDSGATAFDEAITVGLPYYEGRPDGIVDGTDIDETELSLWFFDTASDAWTEISGATVDADADRVEGETTQTGQFAIFHVEMMEMMIVDEDAGTPDAMEPEPDMMAQVGDGGGGGCAMLPMLPPGGGPPDDPTLIGLLGLVTAYLLFRRRCPRPRAAAV